VKGGVTKKIEDTISALDKGQLKKAIYLTEGHEKLSRQHQFVEEAARICLANKHNKEICRAAINEARNKIQDTVSLPIDDTSLEGLEEYMTEQKLPEETIPDVIKVRPVEVKEVPVESPTPPSGFLAKAQKTDEELGKEAFEQCEECHVAVAAAKFADVCAGNREEAGGGCEIIGRSLANENTEPVDWIKAMVQTAEKAEGKAKQEMAGAITELTDYLEGRNSPLLKALDKEESHA
jgi:hypothetical protein